MKALTVRQPWAWAILYAGKNIENRPWRTHYRGPLLIHAGAGRDEAVFPGRLSVPVPDDYVQSAIIGIVDLVDVVESSRSRWFEGPFGWVLANPRPLSTPFPCSGRLSLWTLSPSQERAVKRRIRKGR